MRASTLEGRQAKFDICFRESDEQHIKIRHHTNPCRTVAHSLGCPEIRVCRESRRSPVGANPTRPIGRSAGSNQGDAGGNKFVEVLWCNGSLLGDLATMQAETRVNAEQASKRIMRKPTRLLFREGRRRWTG